jgi:hypothetical protein
MGWRWGIDVGFVVKTINKPGFLLAPKPGLSYEG